MYCKACRAPAVVFVMCCGHSTPPPSPLPNPSKGHGSDLPVHPAEALAGARPKPARSCAGQSLEESKQFGFFLQVAIVLYTWVSGCSQKDDVSQCALDQITHPATGDGGAPLWCSHFPPDESCPVACAASLSAWAAAACEPGTAFSLPWVP